MAIPTYQMRPLSEQEVAANQGYTHRARINAADLTVTATNTVQLFDIGPIPVGAQVQVKIDLKTPFKAAADNAFNTCAITIGDTSTANVFLTSTELNANGTYVSFKEGALSAPYTSALTIRVTFGSQTGKALNAIDNGLLFILVKLADVRAADALSNASSTK